MLNLKNKLAKRILAFVLSGAMVVSGMSMSAMTAFAAESSDEAMYYEETNHTISEAEEAEVIEGAEELTENESSNSGTTDGNQNTDGQDEPKSPKAAKSSEPESAEGTKPSEPESSQQNPSTENPDDQSSASDENDDKGEELVAMEANRTYTLDVSALTIKDGVALSDDKVFKLLAGDDTTIAADAATTR
ncbi:MAG: hypothetical protein K2N89_08945, partial [Lachnospiraceae bacterium]|nr:hypothetical protein [Lachnospiraceae bacterium]